MNSKKYSKQTNNPIMAYSSKVIDTYISNKGTEITIAQGREIYEDNKTILKDFDFRKENAIISMHDEDENIKVTIKNFKYLSTLKVECTNHENQEVACKHIIAALYQLDQHLTNYNPEIEFSKKYKKVNPRLNNEYSYVINEFDGLNNITLEDHYSQSNVDTFKIKVLNVKANEIEFEINPTNYFYSDEYQEVIIQNLNNSLKLHCTCKRQGITMCKHSYSLIQYLQENQKSKYLKVLEYDYLDKLKKKYTKELNLKPDQFDDYFTIAFDTDIYVRPSNKAIGLVSLKKDIPLLNFDKINDALIKNLLLDYSDDLSVERNYLPFVSLNFANNDKKYNNVIFDFFMAQEGKSVAYKNYRIYDSAFCSELTENQALIKQFIERYNEDLLKGYAPKLNNKFDQHLFRKVYQIFDLIKHEKHAFGFNHDVLDKVIRKKEVIHLNLNQRNVRFYLKMIKEDLFYALNLFFEIDGLAYEYTKDQDTEILTNGLFRFKNEIHLFSNFDNYVTTSTLIENGSTFRVIHGELPSFVEKIVGPLGLNMEIIWDDSVEIYRDNITLKPLHKKVYLTENQTQLHISPLFEYQTGEEYKIGNVNSKIKWEEDEIKIFHRDYVEENNFKDALVNLHPNFWLQTALPTFSIPYSQVFDQGWFFKVYEKLQKENIEVFGLADLQNLKYSPQKAVFSTQISSGIDWFDIDVEISFGDYKVPLKDIRNAALKKENFVKLGDGKYGVLPEEYVNRIQQYFRAGQIVEGRLVISKMKFNLIEDLFESQDHQAIFDEISEKKRKILSYKEVKSIEVPKDLKATLRDYQLEGYNWLNFLDEFGWGGILADDMGLGKTIQVLSFLLNIKGRTGQANLVIVPTSLLFNWQKEIEKFTPSLKVLYHYGTNRQKRDVEFDQYDIVITSYGLLTRDIELLRKHTFNYIILDESQAIKNPSSLRYKAAKLLMANNRISMSGTPIENNTFDLFAQFNFVNPGFFESIRHFKDQYSTPIDSEGNVERAKELQSLINPFLLRRTKESVAKELPEKTESYLYCEMAKDQATVYENFKHKYRDLLMGKIESDGLGKSKMYVLEGLTKLRQICDSPAILNEDISYANDSIKIKTIVEHVKEKTGQHKILIFSQFVKMLKLLEKELVDIGVNYEYLDGSCSPKQREKSVANFQSDETCRVFLISLKAGGLGLNLTAADYVYIVDPWWNPAVESQAMDRSHRIGQDKKVMVYRMICKGTIEEKIMEYQTRKKKIASDIITTDESYMKNIKFDDIEKLFG